MLGGVVDLVRHEPEVAAVSFVERALLEANGALRNALIVGLHPSPPWSMSNASHAFNARRRSIC
jgi:hypothetical protein